MNTINIIGTLTDDVSLRYPTDMAVGSFSIAYNKKFSKNGKIVEHTSFFDVVCFGRIAETINQYFRKGSRIAITGELEQQRWKAQDGSNRNKVVIRLEKFDFIDKKNTSSENQPQSYYSQEEYPKPRREQPKPMQEESPEMDIDDGDIPF